MAITFTPYLKKKNKDDAHGIINIRITNNRKSTYHSLGFAIATRFWNPKGKCVRSTFEDHQVYNDQIDSAIKQLKEEYKIAEAGNKSVKIGLSFIRYLEVHLEKLKKTKKSGTRKKYNTVYKHLLEFSAQDIKFSDIDYSWIEDFDEYLMLKSIAKNSRNTYLKCIQTIYNKALLERVYRTMENPFVLYKFKNEKVEKRRMSMHHLQSLIKADLSKNQKAEWVRNLFLVQIYGQGLRVSDLLTLRFKNIFFDDVLSRINFVQFKTKTPHTIQLSRHLTKYLFYFFDKEKYDEMYFVRKYRMNHNDKKYNGTLANYYKYSKKIPNYKDGEENKVLGAFTTKLIEIELKVFTEQLKLLMKFAADNPNAFLIPVLSKERFENIEFGSKTILPVKLYDHIQGKITVYNRSLKLLNPICGYSEPVTSHTARHTYANLLLNHKTDIYSISKSLGHSSLAVTESYIADFNVERVDDDNMEVFRMMNLSILRSTPKDWGGS